MSLLQEVLLHASSVAVGFLFALNVEGEGAGRRKRSNSSGKRKKKVAGEAHLSVQTELLDLIDAVDHHVHEGEQRVHVFGRRVAHARHYTQQQTHI